MFLRSIASVMFFSLFLTSVSALASTQIEVIAATHPNGRTVDHVDYFVVLIDGLGKRYTDDVIPMTEDVVAQIKNLSDGNHICEGRRFKAQIFELSNCKIKN